MKTFLEKTIPTIEDSMKMIDEAYERNPGLWREHSINCAKAARAIAGKSKNLDPDTAFQMGLLHDIGRREGVSHLKHTIDGYKFLTQMKYDNLARICLSHSFSIKDIRYYSGEADCSKEDYDFIVNFLKNTEYDEYDLLIQLCDALALPQGITIIEKRFFDVVSRHGYDEYSFAKWSKVFEIKGYFDSIIGKSIYCLFKEEIDYGIYR